ncbi:hypothetical protein [Lacrimispora sp.]|uniref:hypothetical protein n=1 Tax=Lacrimispora sp. TaxID=2719234 RepID=UPI0028AD09FC|nr:hypothetical protein [Lacrimispora sp.]
MIKNDGGVCQKSYNLSESKIMRYGRPDWSIVQAMKSGWLQEDGDWRYYLGSTGQTVRSDWIQK